MKSITKDLVGRVITRMHEGDESVYLEFDDGSKLHVYNGYSPMGGHFDRDRYFYMDFIPAPTPEELAIKEEKEAFLIRMEEEKAIAGQIIQKWKNRNKK